MGKVGVIADRDEKLLTSDLETENSTPDGGMSMSSFFESIMTILFSDSADAVTRKTG